MIVAGLDLATKTGVAVGPLGGRPELWTLDLKSKGEARFHATRLMHIQGLAHHLITELGVAHIAVEKPFVAAHNNWETTLLTIGLTANVLSWAERKGAAVDIYSPQTVAKHFIGSGRMKRAEKKAAILAECRARGWAPTDDNQADAAAVWDLACTRLSGAHAAASGPLFQQRGKDPEPRSARAGGAK
jgi:Holliday junction resolvasome RuvABC endonuclease subunit